MSCGRKGLFGHVSFIFRLILERFCFRNNTSMCFHSRPWEPLCTGTGSHSKVVGSVDRLADVVGGVRLTWGVLFEAFTEKQV